MNTLSYAIVGICLVALVATSEESLTPEEADKIISNAAITVAKFSIRNLALSLDIATLQNKSLNSDYLKSLVKGNFDPWGSEYKIILNDKAYKVLSLGPDKTLNTADDISKWGPNI